MYLETFSLLKELEEADWFSRVGMEIHDSSARVLHSWPEAIFACSRPDWEYVRKVTMTNYCVELQRRAPERWSHFEEVFHEIKKLTFPLVERKIAPVVAAHDLPDIFGTQVRGDITSFCLEWDYQDVCPFSFFSGVGSFYLRGHFPCGFVPDAMLKARFVIY